MYLFYFFLFKTCPYLESLNYPANIFKKYQIILQTPKGYVDINMGKWFSVNDRIKMNVQNIFSFFFFLKN